MEFGVSVVRRCVFLWIVFVSSFICMKPFSLHAQDYRPFTQEGEQALQRNVEEFRQRQQQRTSTQQDRNRYNNNLFADQIREPFDNYLDFEPFNGPRIENTREGAEFRDNPFANPEAGSRRRNRADRFEARGGDERPLEVDVERSRLVRERQLEARMEIRSGEGRDNRRRTNQDTQTQIDQRDIDELEGRAQQADEEDRFEEEFLAAEQALEREQTVENAGEGNEGRGANRRLANARGINARGRAQRQAQLTNGRVDGQDAQSVARAQTNQEGDPNDITGSIRPNAQEDIYAPQGKRIGSFLLFPEVTITGFYSDNPTASPANRPGDIGLELEPSFVLRSDWSRHELEFQGQFITSYFEELTTENTQEWFLAAGTRIDIQNNHFIRLDARIENTQDNRGDIDNQNTDAELANVLTSTFSTLYNYEWNRTTLQLSGTLEDVDNEDTVDSQGTVTNNDDEDYLETSTAVRLSYTFNPGHYVYSEGRYINRDYDTFVNDGGFQRGSDTYAAEAGIIFDVSAVLRLVATIGNHWQQADDTRLEDINEVIYNAALTYRPSEQTTLVVSTGRDVEGTDLEGTIGVVETNYGALLTHYFRPHVRMTSSLTYEQEEYPGIQTEQNTLTAELTLQYILNRHARLLASYEFSDVETNNGDDYQENLIRLGITLRP